MLRFRVGLAAGFAVGYYLGAKAGRARYDEIRGRIEWLQRTQPLTKVRAAIDLGIERLRGDHEEMVQLVLVDEPAHSRV